MKKILLILGVLIVSCKNTQGTVNVGEEGKIIDGKIIVKCTKPPKTYTKDLDLRINSELESLKNVPNSDVSVELKKSVVKLTQYTSQGLDRDLMFFRICEIANNRGLSQKETTDLINSAISAYDDEVKKKSQR
ncbi:hypothetical protein [Aquimarina sp. 2201CG5-10]|uniref:hypothetical protein n=1 Tax=Aquimarina callyspongiae TaxID=3098150 RepID=UPI002AB4ED87|nr:hypothetical protein [Aquimarina sp. 2201CG5-10]MDY8135583.1 hypothetical protein [Aquimarina sp. 2201CG5-10]